MITQSKIRQHSERSVPEQASEILAEGLVAHVGFCLGWKTLCSSLLLPL